MEFRRSKFDSLYIFDLNKRGFTYLLIYVDEILIASQQKLEIEEIKKVLKAEFYMKDLGLQRRY